SGRVRPCQGRSRGFKSRLPLQILCVRSPLQEGILVARQADGPQWTFSASGAKLISGRGTQVVRERSAKPLCVGSIPTRASNLSLQFAELAPAPKAAQSLNYRVSPSLRSSGSDTVYLAAEGLQFPGKAVFFSQTTPRA